MINPEQLSLYQDSLGYLGQQINFPEKMTFHPKILGGTISRSHPSYEDSLTYKGVMVNYTLSEIKAIYMDTFDFNKEHPFHMAFNRSDTQEERGQMLAELEILYEILGLKMVDNELSDLLPSMLQFSQVADFKNDSRAQENLQLVIVITEDGMYEMANTLTENSSPYVYVVSALRRALKAYIVPLKEVENYA